MTLRPFADRPYRQGVGIMLLNQDHSIFVGQRLDTPGAWQMPQGGLDDGESPQQAAFRELAEETGCPKEKAQKLMEHPEWLSYDLPFSLADSLWQGRYRGQTQKWFALQFFGTEAEIDLATHDREFSKWRWASPQELPKIAVSFKRPLYTKLLEDLYPKALDKAATIL